VAADAASSEALFLVDAQETATGSDQADSLHFFGAFADEAAAALDAISAAIGFAVNADEAASGVDAASSLSNFVVFADETVVASDAALGFANFIASVSETALALDSLTGRYLWEPIDNDQNPSWTDVLPSVTITEVATFAGGTFGGFPYAGSITSTFSPFQTQWTEINNDQNPGWTPIDAPS
jgi:hypothetical protein